jgi:uncharacterized protein YjiK
VKYKKAKSQLCRSNCGFLLKVLLISAVLVINACDESDENNNAVMLKPVASYYVDILETSDLCFGSTKDVLFTVSDNTAKAYKINTTGKVLAEYKFTGNDLEGICFVDNQYIYVAEERLRKVVKLDLQGNKISEKVIPVEYNQENEGLEGIAYATFNQHFYILNEMNPGILIETDKNLNVLNMYDLTFADDYSGVCLDNLNKELWILSDMSATANKCTMQAVLIESFSVPVTNPEGIAFYSQDSTLYIISDSQSRLYKFDLKTNNKK